MKEEQLLFDTDINKTLRRLRQRRKRDQKSRAVEKICGTIMVEKNNGHDNRQPQRTLGDYAL